MIPFSLLSLLIRIAVLYSEGGGIPVPLFFPLIFSRAVRG